MRASVLPLCLGFGSGMAAMLAVPQWGAQDVEAAVLACGAASKSDGLPAPAAHTALPAAPTAWLDDAGMPPSLGGGKPYQSTILLPDGCFPILGGTSRAEWRLNATWPPPQVEEPAVIHARWYPTSVERPPLRRWGGERSSVPRGAEAVDRDRPAAPASDYELLVPEPTEVSRPTVCSTTPSTMTAGSSSFTVQYRYRGTDASVSKVVLIGSCSATHHHETHQRRVELPITASTSSSVTATPPAVMPSSASEAWTMHEPDGSCLLFLVMSDGACSDGHAVRVR